MKLPWWAHTPERAETCKKLFIWVAMAIYYLISLAILWFVTAQKL
jgi:hypothetical protein